MGCCERAGGGWQVDVVEEAKSCDAESSSWSWQRNCSSWDAEARPFAFGDLLVDL